MKNYLFPVYLVTGFLVVYVVAVYAPLHPAIVFFLFAISPIFVLWMVYKVLTADVKVKHSFEDRWYESSKAPNRGYKSKH